MTGVKPVQDKEVSDALKSMEIDGLDVYAELLKRLWECNRDQAAYITQMKETWNEVAKAAAKAKRQGSLF